MQHILPLIATLFFGTRALAHEGHGLPGASHWHASDAVGLAVGLGLALAVWWWARRK